MLGLQFSVFTSFELLRENKQGGGGGVENSPNPDWG